MFRVNQSFNKNFVESNIELRSIQFFRGLYCLFFSIVYRTIKYNCFLIKKSVLVKRLILCKIIAWFTKNNCKSSRISNNKWNHNIKLFTNKLNIYLNRSKGDELNKPLEPKTEQGYWKGFTWYHSSQKWSAMQRSIWQMICWSFSIEMQQWTKVELDLCNF